MRFSLVIVCAASFVSALTAPKGHNNGQAPRKFWDPPRESTASESFLLDS